MGLATLALVALVLGNGPSAAGSIAVARAPSGSSLESSSAQSRAWTASGDICVRLSRHESRPSVVITGGLGSEAPMKIARAGDSLTVNGRSVENAAASQTAAELWIEPRDKEAGLVLDGVTYCGRLRIRLPQGPDASTRNGLSVDNIVDFEDYIAGVVAGETQLLGAEIAELEAQAIASRSFALAQLSARGSRSLEVRLFDSTRDQAYAGKFAPTRDPRSQAASRALALAIERTRGKILKDGSECLDARFHAACGGRTASSEDVFPEAARFVSLRGVDCAACRNELGPVSGTGSSTLPAAARDLSWRTLLTREQLDQLAINLNVGDRILRIEPVRRDRIGRWIEVEVRGTQSARKLSFEHVRRELKTGAISSNLVLITGPRAGTDIVDTLLLSGRGRGHGVGLCQNGCRELALRGWSAAKILEHYYPGTSLVDGR